jgi:ribonuclease P protein component
MIARRNRFHGYGSLRYVYQHGTTVRGPLCAIKFVPNAKRETYRLAVVVSKKVSKSAVVRNRIRRRLFEAVRLEASRLNAPYDMVITVFNDQPATLPSDDVRKMISAQLKQGRLV